MASKTTFGLSARRVDHAYDAGAQVFGTRLREVLNRREDSLIGRIDHRLTPLTTVVLQGEATHQQFVFSRDRDGDSIRVLTGFDLAPLALISGRARIGFLKFDGVGGGVADFSGLIGSVDVAYTLLGRTRLEMQSDRDLVYSFERLYPYYLNTGVSLTVTPRLTIHWDVQGRIGYQRLAYRESTAPAVVLDRMDRYNLYGGGIGYNVGRDVRIGFNIDRERRLTDSQFRAYEGYRIGTSVAYATR